MIILKSAQYNKVYKKKIVDKHLTKEIARIEDIENAIYNEENLEDLIHSSAKIIFNIEQKSGPLKEIYTARVNSKIRLWMKPVGEYPYNKIEITEIEFINIDDKHYGEG